MATVLDISARDSFLHLVRAGGVDTCTEATSGHPGVVRPCTATESAALDRAENADARETLILGAKDRARQITALAQTPGARGATAWTQPQRVAVLDAVGDLARMLSWLADDLCAAPEPPD
jgi:hypothetical protein